MKRGCGAEEGLVLTIHSRECQCRRHSAGRVLPCRSAFRFEGPQSGCASAQAQDGEPYEPGGPWHLH